MVKNWLGRKGLHYMESLTEVEKQVCDKTMYDKVIRKLTTKSINDQMTSEDALIWAKRLKAQRTQAAILSDITDSQKFDRVKSGKKTSNT